ncbi:AraC-type DNA-binding protein [Reichenbachiella faecimaris]|uniref:AraC-type DNA-binding protein n=1 Tax=Reichenbachiella faecimaris TaxID=692418 RepID=A0A1W2G6U1_REIFA|nr:response regulator transcription factor [Reichenbachiella faecimaris]SMD32343.1 AraC-type DNA-binding protein [Reichenbachiella faecimaris]
MSSIVNIKNMVCPRCITAVEHIFDQLDLEVNSIQLGRVELKSNSLNQDQISVLDFQLEKQGFARIDDGKSKLLEQIKTLIIDMIHHQDHSNFNVNWSTFLSEKLDYEYHYLSTLFSSVAGITLEQFIIRQKVEKVKEYLIYNQLSIKEIAYKLGYSSVAHLSSQFKKTTGMTPTVFKTDRSSNLRKPLDSIL